MKLDEKYAKIVESISKMEKSNEKDSDISTKFVRLLKIDHLQFLATTPETSILIVADVLDCNLQKKENINMVYYSVDSISPEIFMTMISSFSFGNGTPHDLQLVIEGSPQETYLITSVMIKS